MIRNVHQRTIAAEPAAVGRLLDLLPGKESPIWPVDAWPELAFDRPLSVGATGGHGPIRYSCVAYLPGRRIECEFAPDAPILGTHTLDVVAGPTPDTCVLRHVIDARPRGWGRITWPLMIRWFHDALLEDLLDRASAAVGDAPARPATWSPWVRFLRRALAKRRADTPVRPIKDSDITRKAV